MTTKPTLYSIGAILLLVACGGGGERTIVDPPPPGSSDFVLTIQSDDEDVGVAQQLGWTSGIPGAEVTRHRAARGVIFHSDRGSEYMGAPFCAQVAQLGLLQSASVRGPGDNAHAESFFHSLKAELTR